MSLRQLSSTGLRAYRSLPISVFLPATYIFTPTALAQQAPQLINPNAVPSCALNCALLNQAQGACLPPAAPVSNQAGYTACFCQSAYLQPLYNSPNGVCDAECANDPTSLSQIQNWYQGLCKNAGVAQPSTATGATATTTPLPGATSTTTSSNAGTVVEGPSGSWISNHWQWIIYILVVILAIVLLIFALRWFKKRRNARHAAMMGHAGASSSSYNANGRSEQGLTSTQPQMAATTASASQTIIPAPAPTQQVARSFSNRASFSASRDSLPYYPATAGRSRSNSMRDSRVASPPPVVWGPHQNQAHSRGFGYGGSDVDIPPPRPQSANRSNRNSWGPQSPTSLAAARSQEMLREVDEEEDPIQRPHTAGPAMPDLADGVRRKLSKRKP